MPCFPMHLFAPTHNLRLLFCSAIVKKNYFQKQSHFCRSGKLGILFTLPEAYCLNWMQALRFLERSCVVLFLCFLEFLLEG